MPSIPPSPSELYIPSWNTWSISTIVTVCTIFLLVINYRLLKRLYNILHGAVYGRNQVQSEANPNPNDPSLPIRRSHGLESLTTRSLPISQFKKNQESEPTTRINTDCAVCLGEFEEGELIRNLPNCNHSFHSSCIDIWFRNHSNCPLCRSPALDCSNSDSPSREEFSRERAENYQTIRSQILQNSALRRNASIERVFLQEAIRNG